MVHSYENVIKPKALDQVGISFPFVWLLASTQRLYPMDILGMNGVWENEY